MSADVLPAFPAPAIINANGMRIGEPVRSIDWVYFAAHYNYLLGRSNVLVPTFYVGQAVAATTTKTLRMRVRTKAQATHRLWIIGARSDTPSRYTFTDASGGTWTAGTRGAAAGAELGFDVPQLIVETVTSRSSGAVTLAPTFAVATGLPTVTITTLMCVEVPRPSLAVDGTDLGVDLDAFIGSGVPSPITDANLARIGAYMDVVRDTDVRNLFVWARDDGSPLVVSTGTTTQLFTVPPVVLARSLNGDSEAVRTVDAMCRARATDGSTTGTVRITMASGDTLDFTVSGTSFTQQTGSVDVHTEDPTTGDGRRSSTWDTATCAAWRTAGSGSIEISSLSLFNG